MGAAMSKEAYQDYVESTYVEPGHDVADAGPVAWQIRTKRLDAKNAKWTLWLGDQKPDLDTNFYEIRPLYTKEQLK